MQIAAFIKKYKGIVIAGTVIIVAAIIVTLGRPAGPPPSELSPVIKNPPTDVTPDDTTLYVVSVTPPDNYRNNLDNTSPIMFIFNKAIDINTLALSVTPNIELSTEVAGEGKNELVIRPKNYVWGTSILYQITLLNLSAVDGSKMKDKIVYRYFTSPPPIIYDVPE